MFVQGLKHCEQMSNFIFFLFKISNFFWVFEPFDFVFMANTFFLYNERNVIVNISSYTNMSIEFCLYARDNFENVMLKKKNKIISFSDI